MEKLKNGDAFDSKIEPINTDVIEKSIGVIGRWQLWVCFIIYLTKFAVAWHQMNIVFLAPKIDFHCANASIDKCSSECTEYVYDTSVFTNTITSQWNLICGRQYLESLAQTLAMLGILIGSMAFGYLSDMYGRRNALVAAIALQGVCGLGEAFSPWLWLFLLTRFLTSIATGGTMVTGFVLVMEIVGSKWRTLAGVLYQIPFSVGHMIMPVISYYLRDWRYFIVATSAPSLFLISYYWILPESPRWQLAVGKKAEATKTLMKAAKLNKLPTNTIETEINKYLENKNITTEERQKGNILDLLRTPIIRTYTIVLWLNWIFVSFSFFGANQMMGQIGGDIFLNVSLPGVIGIPGILLSYWGVEHWGRKKTLIFGNCLAGATLILTAIVPSDPTWIKTVIASVGISALMFSFTTVYIYAGEVFPTVVRNVGLGSSSTWARVGSMVAPFIATLSTQAWVVPVIFGAVILLSAGLCFKLPETLHCKLPETVEDVEQFEMNKR